MAGFLNWFYRLEGSIGSLFLSGGFWKGHQVEPGEKEAVMKSKVWVIDDQKLDALPGMTETVVQEQENSAKESESLSETSHKNPSASFSLSMLVWGGGHMYIGQWRPGLIYLGCMALFYSIIAVVVFCWGSVARFNSDMPELIGAAMVLFLSGLLVWMFNAVDSYYRTFRQRTEPFLGVERIFLPPAASFFFPGWGQFLNVQPRKGIFFLLFGVGGVFSVFALFLIKHVWPLLATGQERHILEVCLISVFSFAPVVLLMWFVSIYDAFRSCQDFLRYRQRSKSEGYRLKRRGFLGDLVPQCSAVLGLMLAISLGMQSIPKQYYLDSLKNVRVDMLNNHMTILPELIQKTIEFLS